MNKKIINGIILILIFAIGFFSGSIFNAKKAEQNKETTKVNIGENTTAPLENDMLGDIVMDDIRSLSGEIKAIKENKIEIEVDSNLYGGSKVKTVIVDENTKILKQKEKSQDQFRKEMEEFDRKMQEQQSSEVSTENQESEAGEVVMSDPILPPDMFTYEEITLSDLTVGQIASFSAEENIKNKDSFIVNEVRIIESVIPEDPILAEPEVTDLVIPSE